MFTKEDKKFLLAMAFMMIGVLGCVNSVSMMWHSKNFLSFYGKSQMSKTLVKQLQKKQMCREPSFTIYEQ